MNSSRYLVEQKYFKEKVEALGGEPLFASAEYDDKLQISQAHEMIEKGVSVLIVNSVNMNTAAAIVRDAHENGVKVIAHDRLIRNSDLDFFISYDNVKVGKLMAESITKIKPDGNYLLFGGDKADQNAVLVKAGQLEVLKKYEGKINIAYNVYIEDWSADNAYQELERYLNLSTIEPDAILSSYDGMTTACIKVLQKHNLAGKTLITGQDAELDACRNIVNDLQTVTIYKPFKPMIEKAAEIAYQMASNKDFEKNTSVNNGETDVPALFLEPIAVDKNNMRNTIIADGFFTESQVYN
jgi:D-xylose transport system substrate-binding protein